MATTEPSGLEALFRALEARVPKFGKRKRGELVVAMGQVRAGFAVIESNNCIEADTLDKLVDRLTLYYGASRSNIVAAVKVLSDNNVIVRRSAVLGRKTFFRFEEHRYERAISKYATADGNLNDLVAV